MSEIGQKFLKNNYKKIKADFIEWAAGNQEDDPIPFEIDSVKFIIKKSSNIYEISLSGEESPISEGMDYGVYFPLELQFFYCPELLNINKLKLVSSKKDAFVLELFKSLIKDFLNSKHSYFLKGRSVYVGYYFKKPERIR